jgi:pimeloyl-[acyl-carrier protein] methyl ester esterase
MSDLHVEMRGHGPDLVLLHGWGLNLRVWDGLTRELAKHFRVIAVDLPGHGRSAWNAKARTPAEQAWQVHAALSSRSDRYSLLGWSLGGQIALDLAAAMPGNVERLVLVATTPRFAASEDWPHGMPATSLDKLATQLRTNYKRTVSEFLELQVRGSAASEKVLADLHASLFSHGEAHPKALVAGLATLKNSDLRSMLGLIHAPALVIAGQYDRVTLPAASRALAAALPDARYVEFRRAAHAPFLSHTPEFASLVTRFLQGAPIEATPPTERSPNAERTAQTERSPSTKAPPASSAAASPSANLPPGRAALQDALVAERILTGGEPTDASSAGALQGFPPQSASEDDVAQALAPKGPAHAAVSRALALGSGQAHSGLPGSVQAPDPGQASAAGQAHSGAAARARARTVEQARAAIEESAQAQTDAQPHASERAVATKGAKRASDASPANTTRKRSSGKSG